MAATAFRDRQDELVELVGLYFTEVDMLFRIIGGLTLVFSVAACETEQNGLRAVSPTLDATSVVRATTDRQTIMTALHQDASLGKGQVVDSSNGKLTMVAANSASWYETTLAGFNFVDDQCSSYFNKLFRLERNSRATVSGLGAFAQTANAILAASGESALTLTSVAQAFGLASSMTEIVSNSFLYQLPPATTREFVNTTMRAYRSAVAKEAGTIDNPALAYSYIRGYLDLCLPVTIEGMLVDTISSTEAKPGEAAGGQVNIGLSSSAGSLAALVQPQNTRAPLTRAPQVTLNVAEETLSPAEVRDIQVFLCVDGSSVDSKLGNKTRQEMAQFFDGLGSPHTEIAEGKITQAEVDLLLSKIDRNDDNSVKTCKERGLKTAREVGLRS